VNFMCVIGDESFAKTTSKDDEKLERLVSI